MARQRRGEGSCANLGHPEDERGLVYMRARYYEPLTGRFLSEDPGRNGINWYLYADGNPVNRVDPDGQYSTVGMAAAIAWFLYLTFQFIRGDKSNLYNAAKYALGLCMTLLVYGYAAPSSSEGGIMKALAEIGKSVDPKLKQILKDIADSLGVSVRLPGGIAVTAFYAGYGLFLLYLMAWVSDFEDASWQPVEFKQQGGP
ncbi:MAG: RHS repeat-associated core domain-containing protein [Candidatus Caldarchaeum sp.]